MQVIIPLPLNKTAAENLRIDLSLVKKEYPSATVPLKDMSVIRVPGRPRRTEKPAQAVGILPKSS